MKPRRVLIIGGSLGGLFAANLLHQQGCHIEVFERVGDDLATRGAGIGTHDELFTVLQRIGITIDPTIGVPIAAAAASDLLAWGACNHSIPAGRCKG